MKVKVYNQNAQAIRDAELSPKVFEAKANPGLIHFAIVAQMANNRQVLAHTKDRSEVRGGGRKPWKQKGTGRARAGSRVSPIWKGGGITFGPLKERNFSKKINKKEKQLAILAALSDKAENNALVALDKFDLADHKTKAFNKIIEKLNALFGAQEQENKKTEKQDNAETPNPQPPKPKTPKKSILILDESKNENLKRAGNNLKGLNILNLENINIVDLVKYRNLILTVDGIKALEEKYN